MKNHYLKVCAFFIALSTASVFGQDVWIAGTGDWFNGANWSAGVPTAASNAQVNNGGQANITGPGAVANQLGIGFALSTDSGTVNLSDSSTLAVGSTIVVGGAGTGTLQIAVDSTGVNGGDSLFIGELGGSSGTVQVTGPDSSFSLTTAGSAFVGFFGDGEMHITNGAGVQTGGDAVIGFGVGSRGLVQVDGVNGFASEWTIFGNLAVGEFGRGELDITNGAEVDPLQVAIGAFSGSNGLVVVDGAGSLMNVGHSLFVGGDTTGPGGAGELDITNGGAVNVGNNMTVWGPGSDGRAVLAVDSTYSLTVAGTLIFDGGTLRFLDDTDFINNATLNTTTGTVGMVVDTNGTTSTLSGFLSGPGGLTVGGGGTLFITNFNTFTGTTVVNDASVFIDGSVGGNAVVNALGLLGGTGFIDGSLLNQGVVAPGDSPGTLTVLGNYNQTAAGDFSVETGGLNAGVDSDLLNVLGAATIDGTMHVIRINNFMPLPGDRVTVLSTGAGRFGVFADVIPVNWLGLIQPFADYSDPFTVDIVFQLANTFLSQGITPNQRAVGHALDQAVLDNCIPNAIAFLGQVPVADLPHDYDLIAPEELASIYEMSFSNATVRAMDLERRMDDIRAGSTGFCANGFAPQMAPNAYSKESDGKEVLNKNPAPAFVPTPENRWGIWVTGSGQYVNVDNDDFNATGYTLSHGGVTLGADYRLLSNLAIGLYAGYDQNRAELVGDGKVDENGGNVGGFLTYFIGNFYADLGGGGGWNSFKSRREALLADAVGSGHDSNANVFGAAGYDWHFGCLEVGPTASFQYTNVSLNGFKEHGSLIPLDIHSDDENSLQSTFGARAAYDLHVGTKGVFFRPELRLAWLHEFGDSSYPINANFIGCPGTFTVQGPRIGSDAALVGAGFGLHFSPAFAINVYYNGVFGRDNYDNNGGSGGFTWSF